MKKITTLFLLVVLFSVGMKAEYATQGDGTTYTLESLSKIAESGVTVADGVYTMSTDVTVKAGDKFNVESGVTVKMGDGVTLRIEGNANFEATSKTTFTRNLEADKPKGVVIVDETESATKFKNIVFDYCGLRDLSVKGLEIDNCDFTNNTGASSSSGALAFSSATACYKVTNCKFENNANPAIGGAANYTNGLVIENCNIVDNNTSNSNKPQLNLTVGGDNEVIIRNCTLVGAKRTKVGAIAVANMLGLPGSNKVTIENNDIRYHRYGIMIMGKLEALIKDNKIIDNQYDPSAMNGGSGISIYDSTGNLEAKVTGNQIESNLWGITVIGGKNVNLGNVQDPTSKDYNPGKNTFKDNGNGGVLYDLYNNTKLTVYAQGNKWNVDEQTAEKIETVIFHKNDDANLGEVIYMPAMDESGVSAATKDNEVYFADGKIVVKSSKEAKVDVYALNGTLVASLSAVNGVANLSGLPKGVYVAKVGGEVVKFCL